MRITIEDVDEVLVPIDVFEMAIVNQQDERIGRAARRCRHRDSVPPGPFASASR